MQRYSFEVAKMKVPLAFILYLIYISATTAGDTKTSEFGCTFDDADYNVHYVEDKRWPIGPVYGEAKEGALSFKDEAEFRKFYDKLEDMRKNLFQSGKYVYNTLEPFVKFYEDYAASKQSEFKNFFQGYVPKFPSLNATVPLPGNSWNGMSWLYKALVQYDERVKQHFVMAACNRDVTEEQLKELESGYATDPPNWFQADHVTGVIRFSVEEKHFGYVIIDLKLALKSSPIVMENANHTLHKHESLSGVRNIPIRYVLKGQPGATPSYIQMNFIEKLWDQEIIPSMRVLFMRRSFCSLAVIEKAALLHPLRQMFHYNEDADLTALINTHLIVVPEVDPKSKAIPSKRPPSRRKPFVLMTVFTSKTESQVDRPELELFSKKEYSNPVLNKIADQLHLNKTAVTHELNTMSVAQNNQAFVKDLMEMYKTSRGPTNLSTLRKALDGIKFKN